MHEWVFVLWRVAAACLVSLGLSLLAMLTVKRLGVELKDMNSRSNPKVLAVAGFFNLLFLAAVAVLLHVGDGAPFSVLGFSLTWRSIGLAAAVLAGTPITACLFVILLQKKGTIAARRNPDFWKSLRRDPVLPLAFAVLFIAALQEEVLFRGYFAFAMRAYGWVTVMLVSALAFTAWHFLTNRATLFQTLDWLLGGLMLFYVYHATGSVTAAALVHFSRNAANVLIFNIAGSGGWWRFDKPVPPAWKTVYTLVHSVLAAGLAYWLFCPF